MTHRQSSKRKQKKVLTINCKKKNDLQQKGEHRYQKESSKVILLSVVIIVYFLKDHSALKKTDKTIEYKTSFGLAFLNSKKAFQLLTVCY